jgi:uncharacterized protein (TIGR01777 family)
MRVEGNAAGLRLAEGSQAVLRVLKGPLRGRWRLRVDQVRPGYLLGMEVLSPRRRKWQYWLRCLPGEHPHECVVEERVDCPESGWGRSARDAEVKRILFFRHRTLKTDLERESQDVAQVPRTVLLAGATGMIGRKLVPFLRQMGHQVRVLSTGNRVGTLHWDPATGLLDPKHLEGVDVVLNLCGSTVACRWTARNRQRITDSRLLSTALLARTFAEAGLHPSLWIQFSGVGYYGYHQPRQVCEAAAVGTGFLASLCEQWEKAASAAPVDRLVSLRLGSVLTPEGGVLARLLPLFRMGLGGALGSGEQYFPWISMNDLLALIAFVMAKPGVRGAVNACVPDTPTQRQFSRSLALAVQRAPFLPVPGPLLSAVYGNMARELLLGGAEVLPKAALEAGFEFSEPSLSELFRMNLGTW